MPANRVELNGAASNLQLGKTGVKLPEKNAILTRKKS